MREAYFSLLKQWCDELITLQLRNTGRAELDGGIICPACHVIHGRCHDAVYPLMYMADATGETRYLDAARELFKWAENLLADDGSFYNDAQSPWNGITVFSMNDLALALKHHGQLLDDAERNDWETRLRTMAEWLCREDILGYKYVVNYVANCAGALALAGEYFGCGRYIEKARAMAAVCVDYFTENGLLMGEGKPRNAITPRGCRAIDIGYNVEETLAALLRYALVTGDDEMKAKAVTSMRAHLEFMLPDGGWDNSFGSRNFKWTYWGSRTSDGCQVGYTALGREIPEFYEAARRNVELFRELSYGGLMYGGPHYRAHGELPCVHHSFCHAAALAAALDNGLENAPECGIPSDAPECVKYYPELDTYRLAAGDFRATVTAYDFDYMPGGHASGGVMSLLWHRAVGPVLASGMTDYSLAEPTNMQQTLRKELIAPLAARMELVRDGVRYSQMYDFNCDMTCEEREDGADMHVAAALVDIDHHAPAFRAVCNMKYELRGSGVTLSGHVSKGAAADASLIVPVILSDDEEWERISGGRLILHREGGDVEIGISGLRSEPRRIFNFSGGFSALELKVAPDDTGLFSINICINDR